MELIAQFDKTAESSLASFQKKMSMKDVNLRDMSTKLQRTFTSPNILNRKRSQRDITEGEGDGKSSEQDDEAPKFVEDMFNDGDFEDLGEEEE